MQLPSLGTPTYRLCLHYLLVGTPCEYHFPVVFFLHAKNLFTICWLRAGGIRTSCVDYIQVLFLCPHKVYVHQAQAGFSLVPDMPPGSITRDGLLLSLFSLSRPKGPDGVVRPLKDRIRKLCKQRRIRLQEFFKPFDVHHNKKVNG